MKTTKNSLIGIILVAQSQLGGAQLCFRYPMNNSSVQVDSILKSKEEFILPSKSALPVVIKRSAFEPFHLDCSTLANLLCPTSSLCNQHFELIVDKTMFISYPSLFGKQSVEGNEKSVADRRAASLSTFNFVLAIERNSINSNNNPSLVKMCSSIVKQLSTVAHYEENRCGFLRSDIVRLLNVRENWSNKLVTSKDKDTSQLLQDLLQTSSLARCMKQIYEDLNENGTCHCRINDWPILSLSLNDYEKHPKRPIRPYQTMLLLEDSDKFLESLPRDSSLSIRTLIQAANPVKCFGQLHTETGIPLSQIYRIVGHLIYWKKVKIIDKLTKLNVYVLNPKKNMSSFLALERDFNLEFSDTSFREVNFREILDAFSVPRKLGENIERIAQGKSQLRLQFIEAVTWFLRHDLLKALHNYAFLVLPLSENSSTLTLRRPSSSQGLSASGASLAHSPQPTGTSLPSSPEKAPEPMTASDSPNARSPLNASTTIPSPTKPAANSALSHSASIILNRASTSVPPIISSEDELTASFLKSSTDDRIASTSEHTSLSIFNDPNVRTGAPISDSDGAEKLAEAIDTTASSSTRSVQPSDSESSPKPSPRRSTLQESEPVALGSLASPKRRSSLQLVRSTPSSPIQVNSRAKIGKSINCKGLSQLTHTSTPSPSPSPLSPRPGPSFPPLSSVHMMQPKMKDSYLLTPAILTSDEEMEIAQYDDLSPTFKLFKNLCPYFKGHHHFEEIMWRENINRETLENILKIYEDILVIVQF